MSHPGDAYEREADAVAERVMGMTPATFARGAEAKAGAEGADGRRRVARRASRATPHQDARASSAPHVSGAPPSVNQVLRAAGEPLDPSARDFFEPRFGHDFSGVRVHTDGGASESARSVGALAYTVGNHVVFGVGRYAPGSAEGRLLLAHELAHVVQQSGGGSHVQASPAVGHPSGEDEAEADAAAVRVAGGRSVSGALRPRKTAALQRAVTVPILPFNQPNAQVCLVHLHGNEQNAQHVAESVWTDYCSNMVRLGSRPTDRCIDVNIRGRSCLADPNRIFSDQAIDDGEPFTSDCACDAAALPAAKAELKAFRPRLEAAIGRCRGGSGDATSGTLPTVAFHNNTDTAASASSLSIRSYLQPTGGATPTKDQLAAREGAARLPTGATNPSILTGTGPDPDLLRDPDNFLLVTNPADFNYFSPTHNVVLQGTTPETTRPSFDDGSLAVRLRNQRYINIEAERKPFTNTASHFYITDRHMAESVMTRLGIPRRPCPAPASTSPASGGTTGSGTTTTPGTTTGTTSTTGTPATSPAATGAALAGATVAGAAGAVAATAAPVRCESVRNALRPCLTECRTFTDLPQLDALKGCWRSQIDALPVRDSVCWMIGMQRPPDAVRTETVMQRDCMLDALRGAAGATGSGITLPSGARGAHYAGWLESDYRPAVRLRGVAGTPQRDIWLRKFNFTYTTTTLNDPNQVFDRVTQDARNTCGSLLGSETKWDPANDSHRVCWGASTIRGHTAPAMPTGARALMADEKQREILQASSAPGVSRHHWGTDFDLFNVHPENWQAGSGGATPNFSAAHDWLAAGRPATATSAAVPPQAGRYGFLQSFTSSSAAGMGYMLEDWHWSYYPVAQALLEYSRGAAVDAELNRQLTALWNGGPEYSRIAANWRAYIQHVNETPVF